MARQHYLWAVMAGILCWAVTAQAQQMTDEEKVEYIMDRLNTPTYQPTFEGMIVDLGDIDMDLVLPPLMDMAKDEDEDELIRINAIYIIGRMGARAERAVGALTRLLISKESSSDIKAVSASALARIGRKASSAVPTLVNLLNDSDPWVVKEVEYALRYIGTRSALEALHRHRQGEDAAVPLEGEAEKNTEQ